MKNLWTLWAKALGAKASPNDDKYSDRVALIRTILILQTIITNFFIVFNIIRNLLK
jgi:hypothetical protein